ncbi:MAG TPA: GIY-YIG nuclease family protein [Verrucomicrobiae bacterium]|nr:GIY-YIG nuclease family protein [Verrucomicrobiae bacterium]
MPAVQQLLFPDPQPLVERLGRDFFRRLPECPGVYLMRDACDTILYVGKAKNLRRRLGSYRVANPDRMPARLLRLLRAVARIELQECPDESAALSRESELLRTVRPRFNRAGTWPAPPRFFAWRSVGQELRFAVAETLDGRWRFHGPLGGGAFVMRAVLARLLWLAVHPHLGFARLPAGWFYGRLDPVIAINCGLLIDPTVSHLEMLLSGQTTEFSAWIRALLPAELHPFERAAVEADLECVSETIERSPRGKRGEDGLAMRLSGDVASPSTPIAHAAPIIGPAPAARICAILDLAPVSNPSRGP